MGTRHLIAVVKDGQYKVAQYGQWDGYPSGQGAVVLDFLLNADLSRFATQIEQVSFISNEELQDRWVECGAKRDQEWVSMDISNAFSECYPENSRNTGARLLSLIQEATRPIKISNSLEFAADSLFCEWGYVIDLDTYTLEVYRGFNEEPLEHHERFYFMQKEPSEYYPIRHFATFSLHALPNEEQFLAQLEEQEEEEV